MGQTKNTFHYVAGLDNEPGTPAEPAPADNSTFTIFTGFAPNGYNSRAENVSIKQRTSQLRKIHYFQRRERFDKTHSKLIDRVLRKHRLRQNRKNNNLKKRAKKREQTELQRKLAKKNRNKKRWKQRIQSN